ncbi:MAG: pseudouridine synthase [Hespellia sp.]|nr:pseudouridine synthase [Hespellia sp.]
MRLDKYLSLAQIGTRKKVKEYIYRGDVRVNGDVICIPAFDVNPSKDKIMYQEKEMSNIEKVCYMFYKPQGCITAKQDENCRTVFDYLTDIDTTGLFAVGRLDKNTEGLLLITNDGELNHLLMNPEHHVEKTYYFWVFGRIDAEEIRRIETGMDIGDGEITIPAKIKVLTTGKYSVLREQMRQEGCYAVKRNLHREEVSSGYLTIFEGKKHQVKRMMKRLGCHVVYLKRVSIGRVVLDETLGKGGYKRIDERCF